MDNTDRELLNIVQMHFPTVHAPFADLAERLGISETEVEERLVRIVEAGTIRRIAPLFDTHRLGYSSTLVAARVPPERLLEVAEIVSSFPEVTHNYAREHTYNLWFTIISCGSVDAIVEEIRKRTGVSEMHSLPAEEIFKLRACFRL